MEEVRRGRGQGEGYSGFKGHVGSARQGRVGSGLPRGPGQARLCPAGAGSWKGVNIAWRGASRPHSWEASAAACPLLQAECGSQGPELPLPSSQTNRKINKTSSHGWPAQLWEGAGRGGPRGSGAGGPVAAVGFCSTGKEEASVCERAKWKKRAGSQSEVSEDLDEAEGAASGGWSRGTGTAPAPGAGTVGDGRGSLWVSNSVTGMPWAGVAGRQRGWGRGPT